MREIKNNIGSYTLIKNDGLFIKEHLDNWLPLLTQMVFYDGNSTDGTLEIIKEAQKGKYGFKIKLFENKDPKDYTEDYVKMFNDCMWELDTEYAMFLHTDMMLDPQSRIVELPKGCIAGSIQVRSFAGDPKDTIYEVFGRGTKWKNIYRLRNPNLGAHYFGAYGAQNEDTYFSEITGNEHKHYGTDFTKYPYSVEDSGIVVKHYSDVRPYERRLERMVRSMVNQGRDEASAKELGLVHPRVTLKPGSGFDFNPVAIPEFLGGIRK